jgi:hypothetical protein
MPHPFGAAGALAPVSTGAAAATAALSVSIVDKGVSWDVTAPLSEDRCLVKSTLLTDSPPSVITSSVGGETSPDSSELFLTDFFLPILIRIKGGKRERERKRGEPFHTFRMILFLTSSILLNNI